MNTGGASVAALRSAPVKLRYPALFVCGLFGMPLAMAALSGLSLGAIGALYGFNRHWSATMSRSDPTSIDATPLQGDIA